eukprot:6202188-Prymnesium_polylepis.1
MRPPRGPTPSAFRCWIAPAATEDGGISADALASASSALRDALWGAVAGKPAISVMAVGNGARSKRPLFEVSDFERFCGRRVQLTFREAFDGRRKLVGELCGLELAEGEPCAIVLDESAGCPMRAPLDKLLLGDKTALNPPAEAAVRSLPERDARKEAAGAALEARLAEMILADQAGDDN